MQKGRLNAGKDGIPRDLTMGRVRMQRGLGFRRKRIREWLEWEEQVYEKGSGQIFCGKLRGWGKCGKEKDSGWGECGHGEDFG